MQWKPFQSHSPISFSDSEVYFCWGLQRAKPHFPGHSDRHWPSEATKALWWANFWCRGLTPPASQSVKLQVSSSHWAIGGLRGFFVVNPIFSKMDHHHHHHHHPSSSSSSSDPFWRLWFSFDSWLAHVAGEYSQFLLNLFWETSCSPAFAPEVLLDHTTLPHHEWLWPDASRTSWIMLSDAMSSLVHRTFYKSFACFVLLKPNWRIWPTHKYRSSLWFDDLSWHQKPSQYQKSASSRCLKARCRYLAMAETSSLGLSCWDFEIALDHEQHSEDLQSYHITRCISWAGGGPATIWIDFEVIRFAKHSPQKASGRLFYCVLR